MATLTEKGLEIYFDDLDEEAQAAVLEFMDVEEAEDAGLHDCPICILAETEAEAEAEAEE